ERYDAGGTRDPAFGGEVTVLTRPAGMAYDIADFVALGPDRKPVLAGRGDTPDGLLIARYQADPDPPSAPGTPDPGTTPAGGTQPPGALSLSGLKLTRRTFVV